MPEEYISREAALTALQDSDLFNTTERQLRAIRELPAANVAEVCFPAELHVGDRAWKKAMSILDKKYAEAKKLPFIRDPLAWALYHTWREFDDGKRCD
jgi:hypothetical protein